MRDFLRLPYLIYQNDPHWVAPLSSEVRRVLNPRRNPYFKDASLELFVCYGSAGPVARAAVVINPRHIRKFGERSAFFGFFVSRDDPEASRYLFRALEVYCLDQGIELIEGPFNPNHYSELGLQISAFGSPPAFFQPYNPEYYMALLEAGGFEVVKVLHTRRNDRIASYVLERYGEQPAPDPPPGYTIRSFSKRDFQAELERIRAVCNDAFSDNWHFLPLSAEEYRFSAKFLGLVTYPRLIKIVEHLGRPVGVLQCVQDINPLLRELKGRAGPVKFLRYQRQRRKIRSVIIYAIGIKKAYQRTQVYRLLLDAVCPLAREFDVMESTWMTEDNIPVLLAAARLGMTPDKKFAIYQKRLGK